MGIDPLLQQACRGDREALEALFQREWRPLFGLAFHALHDRSEAQDVTQEVLLRALSRLDQFQDRGVPFHAYLATIARNLIRDRWRQPVTTTPLQPDLPDHSSLDHELIRADEQALLQRVLAQLPADYQTVIRLRIIEGRSTAEATELMDRSPGALRVLQHRAVVALRACFDKEVNS